MQVAAAQTGTARSAWIAGLVAAGVVAAVAIAGAVWLSLSRPGDRTAAGRAGVLEAHAHVQAERWAEAAQAYERAVATSGKVAADPGVLCEWADALAMSQGGRLQGRPAELVARALELKPSYPKALEMAGSAAYERRDFAQAVRHWRQLSTQLDPASDAGRALQAAIERAEQLARTSLPPR